MGNSRCKRFDGWQEKQILKEYLIRPIAHIANDIGVRPMAITRLLRRKGLKVPRNIAKKWTADNGKRNRFKKGHDVSKIKIGEIRSHMKKGYCYQYVKVSRNKWKLRQHIVWENENGKIPEGYIIVFKDKNIHNFELSNLKLISKAENMLTNSVHNYPKEVIPTLVVLNEIKHKLKDLENGCKDNI